MLVVQTFNDLTKSSFSNNFDQLVSIGDMVSLLDSVVTFFVVKTIIHKSF